MTYEAGSPALGLYLEALREYIHTRSEAALYRASLMSQAFVNDGLGPEEIIALHTDALSHAVVDLPLRERLRAGTDAMQFLLEVMIAYGVHYREYLELRLGQRAREAEEQAAASRERAAAAEAAERSLAAALAVIAHELRTPITAALGSLELAGRPRVREDPAAVARHQERALGAVRRLSRLANDLVEASRGGAVELELQPLDLGEVLARACGWASPAGEQKGVAVECPPDLPRLPVLAHEDSLLSVFGNLLSNAIRYTPPGGRVNVAAGAEQASVWVAVTDTGIGMPPEVLTQIFERFYRAPEAYQMSAEGLGLGLSLVRRLVTALGGRLEVESVVGHGSTFRVLLPRAPDVPTAGIRLAVGGLT